MKNVVLVVKDGCAVGYGKDINVSQKSDNADNILASLKALNEIMKGIPKEASETLYIYLPDLLKGIMSGYAVEYVKTGKQLDNKEIAPEILNEYKLFYQLYAERILNVRFNLASFIPKMRLGKEEMMALRNKAYSELTTVLSTSSVNTVNQVSQVIDPDKELREIFDEQIKTALSAGNMDLYLTLKAERDKLRQPELVSTNGYNNSAVNNEPISFEPSNFDDMASDFAADSEVESKEDNKEPVRDITPNWETTIEG